MKSRACTSVAFLTLLLSASASLAGEPPPPRPSIGPRTNEMLPPPDAPFATTNPVGSDTVRIQNIGNQQLFVSYWDPTASAWKSMGVNSGLSAEIVCSACAGTISVAYHDGKTQRSVKTKTGSVYLLGWSEQQGAWVLTTR